MTVEFRRTCGNVGFPSLTTADKEYQAANPDSPNRYRPDVYGTQRTAREVVAEVAKTASAFCRHDYYLAMYDTRVGTYKAMLQSVVGAEVAKQQLIDAVKGTAAKMLKNPDSAVFRSVHYVDTRQGPVVCGYINGKNAMGAYAGENKLVYISGSIYLIQGDGSDAPPTAKIAWYDYCD